MTNSSQKSASRKSLECKECGGRMKGGRYTVHRGRSERTGIRYYCRDGDCSVIFAIVPRSGDVVWVYRAEVRKREEVPSPLDFLKYASDEQIDRMIERDMKKLEESGVDVMKVDRPKWVRR